MNTITFTIPGQLTTYNEYDSANKASRHKAGDIKKTEGWRVVCAILADLGTNITLMDEVYPVTVHFNWYRKNQLTDVDNVRFAAKFILDGMQQAKLLKNDSMKYVCGLSDGYYVDKERPRTEVIITASPLFVKPLV